MSKPNLQPKPYSSLRRILLLALSVSLLTIFSIILLVITYFFYITEKQTWHSRQHDALVVSQSVIDSFLGQINDSLILAASVDKSYVRLHPAFVSDFLSQQTELQEVIFVDKQGQVYGSASRSEAVLSNIFTIPQSVWFTSAMQGKTYISQVQFTSQSQPYLIISVPSKYGVVSARLGLDVLRNVVLRVRLGQTGGVYIIDRTGELIAHSDASLLGKGDTLLDRPEVQQALARGATGWQGEYTNFSGEQVLGETFPVFNDSWIVFVEISREEAFSTTRLAFMLMSFSAILAFMVSMHVGNVVLKRFIFKPMEVLRSGTVKIGEGDLDHRISFTRHDEIALVGDAFNEMSRKLKMRESALADAMKQAMEANRYKSQMLAHISHDLRTPLSSILGFAEILNEEIDGQLNLQQKDMTGRILVNANRLLSLVNMLLDQAQLERGTLKLREESFAHGKLIESLNTVHGPMAKSKELSLEVKIELGFPAVLYGDMVRLQEILSNLVDNALKFTRQGGVTVSLFCPDAAHWAFSVADTGAGIPDDAREYIFEPFMQVDASTTRKQGGVGLGLSIVKQLVELMGGKITVQSQVGRGSTFTVVLPFLKENIA